jgi:hypothetical protein
MQTLGGFVAIGNPETIRIQSRKAELGNEAFDLCQYFNPFLNEYLVHICVLDSQPILHLVPCSLSSTNSYFQVF